MKPDAFLALSGGLPEPMALVAADGSILAANAAARAFTIAPIVCGQSLDSLLRPAEAVGQWLASCRDGRLMTRGVFAMSGADGRVVDVRCEGIAVRGSDVDAAAAVLVRFKARETAAHERALHAAEARYRAMVENAVLGICRCRADGVILDANPALAAILGYDEVEELGGLSLPERVYAEPEAFLTLVDRVRHAGRVLSADANWTRCDGTIAAVRVSGRFEDPTSGSSLLELLVEDATERRSLEAQLAQAQKMESVGRLAGGIAHDFNNLLTAILGYVDLMQGALSDRDPISRHAQQIRRAAERASMLTRQLLAFSRKQFLQPRVLDVNAVVEESSQMLRRLISENIELESKLDSALLRVKVDPSQLQQVLMNLAVNARDAMPRGGTLSISTANVRLPSGLLERDPEVEPGPYVMLTVTDTGVGMDGRTRARIFEPFFTTKRVGEGTGLGLSTVYGIVRQSGGHVVVDSEPGRGSRFAIYLPAVTEVVDERAPETRPVEATTGHETVLLVEDDGMVRSLAVEALRLKGYRVLEAGDGREALAKAQQHGAAINLLITDVVMPRMTGRELAERLSSTQPDMRVLFMSGYPGSLGTQAGLLENAIDLLEKPFTSLVLVARVRKALDRARPVRASRAK